MTYLPLNYLHLNFPYSSSFTSLRFINSIALICLRVFKSLNPCLLGIEAVYLKSPLHILHNRFGNDRCYPQILRRRGGR